jgi:hypothetical protein
MARDLVWDPLAWLAFMRSGSRTSNGRAADQIKSSRGSWGLGGKRREGQFGSWGNTESGYQLRSVMCADSIKRESQD